MGYLMKIFRILFDSILPTGNGITIQNNTYFLGLPIIEDDGTMNGMKPTISLFSIIWLTSELYLIQSDCFQLIVFTDRSVYISY